MRGSPSALTAYMYVCLHVVGCSPPPVDPNVGRPRKPGVEDVDAADGIRSQQRFLERRVVVEPQALPEPVDRINDHYSTGRLLFLSFLSGLKKKSLFVLTPLRLTFKKLYPRGKKKNPNVWEKKRAFISNAVQLCTINLALTEPFP